MEIPHKPPTAAAAALEVRNTEKTFVSEIEEHLVYLVEIITDNKTDLKSLSLLVVFKLL